MKRVLINGLLLTNNYSGIQYYIENLLHSIPHKEGYYFEVLVFKKYRGRLEQNPNLTLRRVKINHKNRFVRIFYENFILPRYAKRQKFDIYHSPAYVLPIFLQCQGVITIHDLIALDYPLLCQNMTVLYFNLLIPYSIKKSSKIIAVSNTVKMDIVRRFPDIDENKIEVIYHGIDKRFKGNQSLEKIQSVKHRLLLPEKFILFVGNLEPKKNICRIIEAFNDLKKSNKFDHKLVIVGKMGWKFRPIFKLIKEKGLDGEIDILGYINEGDLPAIYSLASLLVFPSLYEGFGLPVLEAMACGCPVIVSDQGALPEISGGYCPQVNPYKSAEIGFSILRVIGDDRYKDLIVQNGVEWSGMFNWDQSVKKTFAVYDSII